MYNEGFLLVCRGSLFTDYNQQPNFDSTPKQMARYHLKCETLSILIKCHYVDSPNKSLQANIKAR